MSAPDRPTSSRGFATRAIVASTRAPRVDQRPNAVPIYQAVTFSAEDAEELGAISTGRTPGYSYARLANPTGDALARAMAELEGAEAGNVFASGMAAIHAALLSVLAAGDRVVATRAIYGSARTLLTGRFGRLGIDVAFVDATDPAAVDAALSAARTRVLYVETISNPTIVVVDLAALAEAAHRHGALLIVDNTFASPALCRPIELGADLVIESLTKYIGGHSDVLGGSVCGSSELIASVKSVEIDTGGTLAPLAAFLVLRGIATLAVRMTRHAASARTLAEWLADQPGVARVYQPDLASHPQHAVAARQFPHASGMFAFELAGESAAARAAGEAFINALTIPERTASLGSIHTIVAHPPTTTHRQYDAAQLVEAGISAGLLRVSVGLEDVEDLIVDFGQALEAARGVAQRVTAGSPTRQPASVGAG
ncbi:MAG: PLP-dependent aspartate aminotransferase family protein [Chloroflexota bacterium]